VLFAGIALSALAQDGAESARPHLGTPLGEAEIARSSITIFPDGRNLPAGRGSARGGAVLYRERCAACHGDSGREGPAARLVGSDGLFSFGDPLRILRVRDHPLLVLSVGGLWPYPTTLFDYIRRAMPHNAPKSLSANETYAVTAYILHLNGLLGMDAVVDAATLPRITMPGLTRTRDECPPDRPCTGDPCVQ